MENSVNSTNLIRKRKARYPKSYIIILLIVSLITVELFAGRSYVDEVIGLLSAGYLVLSRKKISRYDIMTIIVLGIVVIIGLVSNTFSELTSNVFSIGVDVVACTKLILPYFAVKYFLDNDEKQEVINMLVPLCRLFILGAFVCGIISQFVNIGMTSEVRRFGIRPFNYIFNFNFQYIAVYVMVLGIIVCNTTMKQNIRNRYYFMAVISIVLATKGPALALAFLFIFLSYYFKRHQKITVPVYIFIGICMLILGKYQIENYLLTENVPRQLFTKYSLITANHYFPLGSGFSTFGSDQAARNYSPLYYQYGFDTVWGMTPDFGPFLSDNFWQAALGQFGWIGAFLYGYSFLRIFFTFNMSKYDAQKKAFLYAAFIQYMLHGIGSAVLSSSAGQIGFIAMALFAAVDEINIKNKKKISFRLKD